MKGTPGADSTRPDGPSPSRRLGLRGFRPSSTILPGRRALGRGLFDETLCASFRAARRRAGDHTDACGRSSTSRCGRAFPREGTWSPLARRGGRNSSLPPGGSRLMACDQRAHTLAQDGTAPPRGKGCRIRTYIAEHLKPTTTSPISHSTRGGDAASARAPNNIATNRHRPHRTAITSPASTWNWPEPFSPLPYFIISNPTRCGESSLGARGVRLIRLRLLNPSFNLGRPRRDAPLPTTSSAHLDRHCSARRPLEEGVSLRPVRMRRATSARVPRFDWVVAVLARRAD